MGDTSPAGMMASLTAFLDRSPIGREFIAEREKETLEKRRALAVERARLLKDTKALEAARAEEAKAREVLAKAEANHKVALDGVHRAQATSMAVDMTRTAAIGRSESQLRALCPEVIAELIAWIDQECCVLRATAASWVPDGNLINGPMVKDADSPRWRRAMVGNGRAIGRRLATLAAARRQVEALQFDVLDPDDLRGRLAEIRRRLDSDTSIPHAPEAA